MTAAAHERLSLADLPDQEQRLVAAARTARDGAYAPYSGFRVGAAVLTAGGDVVTGANVENAAYPATVCAERVAVTYAVAHGQRGIAVVAVAGTGPTVCAPCGTCRQVLLEFGPDTIVLATGETGPVQRFVLGRDLLPAGFGPDALERE